MDENGESADGTARVGSLEDDVVQGPPAVAIYSAYVLAGLVGLFVLVSFAYGLHRHFRLRRKKKAPGNFRGPGWVWVYILIHYPWLVLLLGLLVPIGLSFLGIHASGYKIEIDMEVEGYLESDIHLMRLDNALKLAVEAQKESAGMARRLEELQDSFERPAPQSVWYWSMDIYYQVKDDQETIFTPGALEEIRAFEQKIKNFPGYADHCLKSRDAVSCLPVESVTNIFFSNQTRLDETQIITRYDGTGELKDINETLQLLAMSGVYWYVDAEFDATQQMSRFTRSRFRGGVPVAGAPTDPRFTKDKESHEEWLQKLYDGLLEDCNKGLKYITISWYEPYHLQEHEVLTTLWHDCLWSVGSFAFVIGFIVLQLRSIVLALAAFVGVVLSFTTGYYFYYVVAGYTQMTLINFLALFLVTGIAADDVLVMSTTYTMSWAAQILGSAPKPRDRMEWAYRKAGSAMLVTTATTCGSFYSLMMSALVLVRKFGFFMGTVVALNYVNVMVIFPSTMLLLELYCSGSVGGCCCCCCSRRKDVKGARDEEATPSTSMMEDNPDMTESNAANTEEAPEQGGSAPRASVISAPRGSVSSMPTLSLPAPTSAPISEVTSPTAASPTATSPRAMLDPTSPSAGRKSETLSSPRRSSSGPPERQTSKRTESTDPTASTNSKRSFSNRRREFFARGKSSKSFGADALDSSRLGWFMRLFHGPVANFVWYGRFILVLLVIASAVTGGVSASQTLVVASGVPQVFKETRNLGRLMLLRTSVFRSYDESDLRDAWSAFSPTAEVVIKVCPETDAGLCNGHGTCSESKVCFCDDGFWGAGCTFEKRDAYLAFAPPSVVVTFVIRSGTVYTGAVLTSQVMLINDGDTPTSWTIDPPEVPWLFVSLLDGALPARQLLQNFSIPSNQKLELRIDPSGKPSGWMASTELVVTRPGQVRDVRMTVVARSVTGPELTALVVVPGAVVINPSTQPQAIEDSLPLSPPFSPSQRYYTVNIPFRDEEVRVLMWYTDLVQAIDVDGEPVSSSWDVPFGGAKGSSSEVITLEVDTARQVAVDAISVELGLRTTYFITLLRSASRAPGAVVLQRVVAGNGNLTVLFKPPADDGGSAISGYDITATPAGSRRLQMDSVRARGLNDGGVPCVPAACWSHATAAEAGEECCEYTLSGLTNEQSYAVSVRAINSFGFGELSVPELSEANWPWLPVAPREVALPPSLPGAPLVEAFHGEVEIALDQNGVTPGGAVPLGLFSCVASPGGAEGSGSASDNIVIDGLTPGQSYTFTCGFTNARPVGDTSASVTSPASAPVTPNVPAPSAPEITAVALEDDKLEVAVNVQDTFVDQISCTVTPDVGGTQVSVSEPVSEPGTVTLQFVGLVDGVVYELQCQLQNTARGRTPASLLGQLSPGLVVRPVPPSPTMTGSPVSQNMGLTAAFEWPDDGFGYPSSFVCTASAEGQVDVVVAAAVSPVVFTGLQNGATYTVTCVAVVAVADVPGSAWRSKPSAASQPVIVGGPPSAPSIVGVTLQGGSTVQISVGNVVHFPPVESYLCLNVDDPSGNATFNVPAGGGAVSSWTVELTVAVVAGRDYTFSCLATNSNGDSPMGAPFTMALITTTGTTLTGTTVTNTTVTETATTTSETATTATATTATATSATTSTTVSITGTTTTATVSTLTTSVTTVTMTTVTVTTVTTNTMTTSSTTSATRTTTSQTATGGAEPPTVTYTTATGTTVTETTSSTTSLTETTTTITDSTTTISATTITTTTATITTVTTTTATATTTTATSTTATTVTDTFTTTTATTTTTSTVTDTTVTSTTTSTTTTTVSTTDTMTTTITSTTTPLEIQGSLQLSASDLALLNTPEGLDAILQAISDITGVPVDQIQVNLTALSENRRLEASRSAGPSATSRRLQVDIEVSFVLLVNPDAGDSVQQTIDTSGASGLASAINSALDAADVNVDVAPVTTTTTTTNTSTTSATMTTTSITSTRVTVPPAPTIEAVEATGDGELTVRTDTPRDLSTRCQSVEDGAQLDETSLGNAVVFSGLTGGQSFNFRCASINEAGEGSYSEPTTQAVTVAIVPSSVEVVSLVPTGDREITITVTADDGWSTVQQTTCRSVLGPSASSSGSGLQVVVGELSAGVSYTFECMVENQVGSSTWGAESASVIALMPPEAPELTCLVPMNEAIVVKIADVSGADPRLAPHTGVECGSPLLGSQVFSSIVDMRVTVRGLDNGVEATVWCRLLSEVGPSEDSKPSQAVMPGIPVISSFELDGSTTSEEATLRELVAEDLSLQPSAVVADVAFEGQSFDGCVHGSAIVARRLATVPSFEVQVKVMVRNDADPQIDTIIRGLNSLAAPTSNLAAKTLATVRQLQRPYVALPGSRDSTLKSISILEADKPAACSLSGAAPSCFTALSPSFDPDVFDYIANITNKSFTVQAVANSSLAFSIETEDGQVLPASYFANALPPEFVRVNLRVTAKDSTSSTYYLRVYLTPLQCGDCQEGVCDGFTGQCICNQGWFGDDCSTYCPGSSLCNGHGQCILSSGCECEDTYNGSGCAMRICPTCENNGTCARGTQALDSTWGCDCGLTHAGPHCEDRRCPNDCSGAGDCNGRTGKCSCYPTHEGEDCSVKTEVLVPINFAVEVTFTWGISGYNSAGEPEYIPDFDFLDGATQDRLLSVCERARANTVVRAEVQCFMEQFEATQFEFPQTDPELLELALSSFMDSNSEYWFDVGTDGPDWTGRVVYVRARLRLNILNSAGIDELEPEYNKWVNFETNTNSEVPPHLRVLITSTSFSQMLVEQRILSSTVASFALSVGVSLVSVLIFTGNIFLSLTTVLSTVLVVASLFGFGMTVLQWEFGAVQAIGMTTFVGMSVDYMLHLSHAYHHSKSTTRREKVRDALVHLGPAILGGALTTAGAAIFIFPTYIYLFYQLGVMLCVNTCIALIYCFLFLAPALAIIGPVGNCGRVWHMLLCRCRRKRTRPPPPSTSFEDNRAASAEEDATDSKHVEPPGIHASEEPITV